MELQGARPHRWESFLLAGAVGGLAAGAVAHLADHPDTGDVIWALTTIGAVVPAVGSMWRSYRRRRPGVDLVAVLALVGCLAVGEFLAGSVIAVMLGSGRVLEARAGARARRELAALLQRAPRVVYRYENGGLASPSLSEVAPGDLLLVKPGDVVAVDGLVERGPAVLDESALTGESLPVERAVGEMVRSGTVNAGGAFDLRATTTAAESGYAAIVRLAEQADAAAAPFVRLADRYALAFVPLTLAVAGVAWVVSGELLRAVAVLVVATPCPLILAAPVAIVSGMSRCARRGVVVKDGAALERLGRAEVLLFDKTGTLTAGRPTDLGPHGRRRRSHRAAAPRRFTRPGVAPCRRLLAGARRSPARADPRAPRSRQRSARPWHPRPRRRPGSGIGQRRMGGGRPSHAMEPDGTASCRP